LACSIRVLRSTITWRCLPRTGTGWPPRDGHELGTQEVDAQVEELLLGEAFPGERELQDRHAGGAEVDDERRPDPGRVLAEHVWEIAVIWALARVDRAFGCSYSLG